MPPETVIYDNVWSFILVGLASGLMGSAALHYAFAIVGVTKSFANDFIAG